MQNKLFKYNLMNAIQNILIREKFENRLELKEFDTPNGFSSVKYSLYLDGKLVASFEDENHDSGAIREAYQYFLGFVDAFIILEKRK